MATRIVEWKKPYTWWKAITVDENKVISLNLREENNLIIYDAWDDEIYVDLQLPNWIKPVDAFPVWVTTGRVIVDNWWDLQGTIICAKTTSGDNIKLLYADEWTLWIDNWTWTFKQIYFKADVDLITGRLQAQIDTLYALWKFLSLWDCADGEPMSFPLETPYEYSTWDWYMIWNVSSATPAVNYRPVWDEWVEDDPSTKEQETEVVETWDVYIYDGTVWLLQKNKLPSWTGDVIWPASATDWNLAVFDGVTWKIIKDWWPVPTWFEPDTQWTTGDVLTKTANWYEWSAPTWWSDIEYVTQAEYDALPSSKLTDWKHYVIYTADSPTPPSPTLYTITWSTTVGSYTPSSFSDIQWCYISPDWTKMYINFWNSFNWKLEQYDLSTPWDVTTATQVRTINVTQPDGIYFSDDWLYFYMGCESDHSIKRYSMSTAWDISTATQDQSLSLSSNYHYQISFSEDGKYMFFGMYTNNIHSLLSYDLTTARDLTTATNQKIYSVQWVVLVWISVKNEWSYLYTADESWSNIKQYELTTPYDITSNKTEIGTYSLTASNDGRAFYVSPDGKYWTFWIWNSWVSITQYQAQPIS